MTKYIFLWVLWSKSEVVNRFIQRRFSKIVCFWNIYQLSKWRIQSRMSSIKPSTTAWSWWRATDEAANANISDEWCYQEQKRNDLSVMLIMLQINLIGFYRIFNVNRQLCELLVEISCDSLRRDFEFVKICITMRNYAVNKLVVVERKSV